MSAAFDILLVLLVLGLAHLSSRRRTICARWSPSSASGCCSSLAWVRLRSVDVGLTEAAIGGGATGFLLLSAEARLRHGQPPEEAPPP